MYNKSTNTKSCFLPKCNIAHTADAHQRLKSTTATLS